MYEPGFAVIDLETTGLNPRYHHRVVEVGIVTLDATGRVLDRWESLVNPQRDLGPQSIHGIRAAQVLEAPTFAELAPAISSRLRGNVLVAHNLSFDAAFLEHEFTRAGLTLPPMFLQGLCTMRLSHDYVFGNARSLAHCCEFLSVPTGSAHCAGDDAEAAAGLLSRYIDMDPNRPDWEKHLSAVSQLAWPPLEHGPLVRTVQRGFTAEPVHFLQRITAHMTEFSGPAEDEEYLMLLERAMLDRHLSYTEQQELVALAQVLGIGRQRCNDLHRYYLEQLVTAAWADGVITPDEEKDLRLAADALGLPGKVLDDELAKGQKETDTPSPTAKAPLSVAPGSIVVLTGAMTRPRDQFASALRDLGYVVADNVTKKTDVVVAADPDTLSGKAGKARKYGIPVVAEDFLFTGLGVSRV
ncbi:DNA polymerase III subunit epsilon [Arthrobacter saudimassiliensis]|uniref:DNA polymerase III subunit epsilon n=1 Tax=Arthrobacter saudimassiliensis TaxID=1461584 RepID=A0A078MY02_9MICC|nr:DNA polymerase III subunit epsilon [Arthrobacter saudimassiliensis]